MKDFAVEGWETKGIETLEDEGAIQLGRGKVISKKDLAATPGSYPVYSSAKENDGKFGEYGNFMFDEELITWSVDGGGRLFHRPQHKFSITNVGGFVRVLQPERINCRYLYFALSFLHSKVEFDWVRKAHPSVIRKVYNAIPLPPLEDQQRIVAVLDEAFEDLASARANAEANLENAQELFTASLRSLFSDNREDWPLRNIADVCVEFGRGKSRHRPRNDPRLYGGDMPFVQTGDLSKADHFLRKFSQTYSPEGVAQSRVWPKGTVCVAIVGATIGESAILDFDACFPDSVIGMVPDSNKADAEFLDFLLQFVKADLKEAGKGSARDNINLGTFSDRLFPIPDLEAQLAAIERISEIDKQCRRLGKDYAAKVQDLDDLRQSILQKAFAGELT